MLWEFGGIWSEGMSVAAADDDKDGDGRDDEEAVVTGVAVPRALGRRSLIGMYIYGAGAEIEWIVCLLLELLEKSSAGQKAYIGRWNGKRYCGLLGVDETRMLCYN